MERGGTPQAQQGVISSCADALSLGKKRSSTKFKEAGPVGPTSFR